MRRRTVGMFDAMLAALLLLFGCSLGLVVIGALVGFIIKAVRAFL